MNSFTFDNLSLCSFTPETPPRNSAYRLEIRKLYKTARKRASTPKSASRSTNLKTEINNQEILDSKLTKRVGKLNPELLIRFNSNGETKKDLVTPPICQMMRIKDTFVSTTSEFKPVELKAIDQKITIVKKTPMDDELNNLKTSKPIFVQISKGINHKNIIKQHKNENVEIKESMADNRCILDLQKKITIEKNQSKPVDEKLQLITESAQLQHSVPMAPPTPPPICELNSFISALSSQHPKVDTNSTEYFTASISQDKYVVEDAENARKHLLQEIRLGVKLKPMKNYECQCKENS